MLSHSIRKLSEKTNSGIVSVVGCVCVCFNGASYAATTLDDIYQVAEQ